MLGRDIKFKKSFDSLLSFVGVLVPFSLLSTTGNLIFLYPLNYHGNLHEIPTKQLKNIIYLNLWHADPAVCCAIDLGIPHEIWPALGSTRAREKNVEQIRNLRVLVVWVALSFRSTFRRAASMICESYGV